MLLLRRMRAHRGVLTAIALVAALVAATATAVLGVLDAESTGGVRAAFSEAGQDAQSITATVQVTQDPAGQDAAIRRVIGSIAGGVDITRAELPHSPADPLRAVWTITPSAGVRTWDVGGIARLHDALPEALGAVSAVGGTGADVEGGLSDAAAEIESSVIAAVGIAPVAVLLLLVIGVVAVVEPIRLLVRVRQPETVLLRSRGDAAPAATWRMAGELAILVIPAAAIGAAGAAVAVGFVVGTPVSVWTAAAAGGGTALLAIVVGMGVAGQDARKALTRSSADDSGRAGQIVALSVTGLVVLAAAFALWRFAMNDPADGADPVGFLAIPLSLLAVAAIALVAFGPVVGLWAVTAGRSRGLPRSLGTRQLARRSTVYATMILILGLGAGGLVVAAGYGATSTAATQAQRALSVGADLRVGDAPSDLSPAVAASLPGVTSATPLLAADITYGGASASLVASGANATLPAPLLPGGPIALDFTVSPANALPTSATLRVMNAGTGAIIDADLVTQHGDTLVGSLPDGNWSVLRIELTIPPVVDEAAFEAWQDAYFKTHDCSQGCSIDQSAFPPTTFQVSIAGIEAAGGTASLGTGWTMPAPQENGWGFDAGTPPLTVSGTSAFDLGSATVAFVRVGTSSVDVTVTQALADRTGLVVGDPVSLPFAHTGSHVDGTVTAIVDTVPGMSSARAASVDLAAFEAEQIVNGGDPVPADQLWIDSTDPTATLAALRTRYGDDLSVVVAGARPVDAITDAARDALWVAAFGALGLAIAAVIGVAGALIAARRGEGVVLRALGMTAGAQGAVVAGEFAAPVLFALVIGTVGGGVLSWFLVPRLAASAVPDGIAGFGTTTSFDWFPLGIAAGVTLAALAIVVWIVGAAVRRAAGRAVGGELR